MSNAAPTRQPLDDEDVVGEILCRLPPQPSSIIRASLAVKLWRNHAVTSAFRRRLRAHHHHAPVLGVYEKDARTLRFIPAFVSPDRIPPERFSLKVNPDHSYPDNWAVLGCRHGRVLIVNRTRRELLVFDPISGDCREVAFPTDFVNKRHTTNGAVVCEDEGIGDSTKFLVVLVGVWGKGHDGDLSARVYSSETGVWGDLVSTPEHPKPCRVGRLPCTLAGNGLYWWLTEPHGCILHFDLGSQQLAVINRPPVADINIGCSRIIRTEDGGIGLAVLSYPTLRMYNRKVGSHGSTTWVMRKVVEMDKILGYPASMEMEAGQTYITGYTEEAGAIVVSVHYGRKEDYLYVVQLDSMRYKEIGADFLENAYYPYANFYTGGPSALQLPAPLDNDGGASAHRRSNFLLLWTMMGALLKRRMVMPLYLMTRTQAHRRSNFLLVWTMMGALLKRRMLMPLSQRLFDWRTQVSSARTMTHCHCGRRSSFY